MRSRRQAESPQREKRSKSPNFENIPAEHRNTMLEEFMGNEWEEKQHRWHECDKDCHSDSEDILEASPSLCVDGKELKPADLEEDLGKSPLRSAGNWRIQNKSIFLTYKGHLDKKKLEDLFTKVGIWDECYIAHENADPTDPYEHTHAYVIFNTAVNSRDCRIFDFGIAGIPGSLRHPNIKCVGKSKVEDIKVKYYISKEDHSPDLQDLRSICDVWNRAQRKQIIKAKGGKSEGQPGALDIAGIQACKTITEAFKKYCYSAGDVLGIATIWERKDLETRPKMDPEKELFFSWCAEMWSLLLNDNWDYRRFAWLVGRQGLDLKTTFAKCFISNYGGMYLKTASGCSNIATLIHGQLQLGHSMKYIFIDIPRAGRTHKMWDTIECLMDGEMTVTKYKGVPISFTNSRVVIMSNWNPPYFPGEEVDESKLSATEKKEHKDSLTYSSSGTENANDTVSPDRWWIADIVKVTNENDGENDKVLAWRENPAFTNRGEKPKRKLKFKIIKE